MNIKQAEAQSGVSSQNIRFYEREGLLTPDRNPENGYRQYSQKEIDILKQIRILRMLDMPLEQIRKVLSGDISLAHAAKEQCAVLEAQKQQLEKAMSYCMHLSESSREPDQQLQGLLLESCPDMGETGFADKWLSDYRKVVLSEREKVFTFVPDAGVTDPREFTLALLQYARENGLDITVTRESMTPEFTINGIEYQAERYYSAMSRMPVAMIRCQVKYPEDFESGVSPARKGLIKLLNLRWLIVPLILMALPDLLLLQRSQMLTTPEGWLILLGIVALFFAQGYRFWLLHYNMK